jgi:hypothetical protein
VVSVLIQYVMPVTKGRYVVLICGREKIAIGCCFHYIHTNLRHKFRNVEKVMHQVQIIH